MDTRKSAESSRVYVCPSILWARSYRVLSAVCASLSSKCAIAGLWALAVLSSLISTPLEAQWIQTNAPFDYVQSMMSRNGSLFAGPFDGGGGVWLSNDEGSTWSPTGLTDLDVLAFGSDESNVYAGSYLLGVYRSSNNGVDWASVSNGLTSSH